MGFIDTMRAEGHAVESVCRVLREQGCQIAARTYRSSRCSTRVLAARTLTDAQVVHAVRDIAWGTDQHGQRRLTPEGLYGRRKMTAYVRRTVLPDAWAGAVDRAMRTLGLSGVRRDKGVRTTIPAKDGARAGDLLNRDFTAGAPNQVWVTDFTYVRTWAGFVYVAFILDVFSQRIVAWHAATTKATDLVMIPLRMALWERDRQGRPAVAGELIHHSDAAPQDDGTTHHRPGRTAPSGCRAGGRSAGRDGIPSRPHVRCAVRRRRPGRHEPRTAPRRTPARDRHLRSRVALRHAARTGQGRACSCPSPG